MHRHAGRLYTGAECWGQQGWTVGVLAKLDKTELAAALQMVWQHAQPAPRKAKAIGLFHMKQTKLTRSVVGPSILPFLT